MQERKLRKQKDDHHKESPTELETKIANQKNQAEVGSTSSRGNEELLRIRSNLNKNKSNNDI